MIRLSGVISFLWDKGNLDKSYEKHGITPKESEEIFLDESLQVISDVKHSQTEDRFIAIGSSNRDEILFVVFMMRTKKIRILSARKASKKERRFYEQAIKKDSEV